jgi:hypothetical protein
VRRVGASLLASLPASPTALLAIFEVHFLTRRAASRRPTAIPIPLRRAAQVVAVKTMILPANMTGQEKREKMAVMEAAISSSLVHPNIGTAGLWEPNHVRAATRERGYGNTASATRVRPCL